MDSKRKVIKVFNNNLKGSRRRGRPTNGRWNCVQTNITRYKIKTWSERSKTELTGKFHEGDEGPQWTVVPSKRKKKRNCFSTVTVVTRTRPSITLYALFLVCIEFSTAEMKFYRVAAIGITLNVSWFIFSVLGQFWIQTDQIA